jgi:NAD(P)-dependent dehydrogenase (short-subunit alcohol dehydrogenase family)
MVTFLRAHVVDDGVAVGMLAPRGEEFALSISLGPIKTENSQSSNLRTTIDRFDKPWEVVGPAIFLASEAASFVTGETIAVDWGYLASGVNC